ncbi:alpha/beta fold hydrolase [Glaciihabitans sp. dw_435]|uniref:alpha/beta fold hydrolase n=1 Tax=Glaciihabitans sp. dw_435 TaxID=2720081 RepID=UPI001BD4CD97|nr:alpha/beta hydrolase [Glaciihabitans sp. dw_435]
MIETTLSADGTRIAFERSGTGPALVLLGGAFNTRQSAAGLASVLAPQYTVFTVDRRGRGNSGDTQPYAVEREIEDVAAVVEAAGGSAHAYGHSSGAILALEAAAHGVAITKVAAFEPPYTFDPQNPSAVPGTRTADEVLAALDGGDHSLAARTFLQFMGIDEDSIEWMTQAPFWPDMASLAPTLRYEIALTNDGRVPRERFARIGAPTLVMDGGNSPAWAARSVAAVTEAIPGARRVTITGQTHAVEDAAVATVLVEFLK